MLHRDNILALEDKHNRLLRRHHSPTLKRVFPPYSDQGLRTAADAETRRFRFLQFAALRSAHRARHLVAGRFMADFWLIPYKA